MSNDTDITQPSVDTEDAAPARVVIERHIEVPADDDRSRMMPFVAGVLTTAVAFAIGIVVFFAVSDADDDGNIELDVPAVDLDIQE